MTEKLSTYDRLWYWVAAELDKHERQEKAGLPMTRWQRFRYRGLMSFFTFLEDLALDGRR